MNQVKDLASIADVSLLFPIQLPDSEKCGEEQTARYYRWISKERTMFFFNHIWVPIPSQQTAEAWDFEKIKHHVQRGRPIYVRLLHEEDFISDQAILPSRINMDKDGKYNPLAFHELFAKYAFILIPEEIRFKEQTSQELALIQKEEGLSRFRAIFKYASRHTGQDQNANIQRIFECFLDLHQSSSTHLTPFKGIVGGTIKDQLFIDEMETIISSYQSSQKVSIIVDRYGRFLHNYLNNSGQSREFLALGGILATEVVGAMEFSEFKSLFKV